jgi:Flp pilus assembly protein TadG
VVSTSLTRPVHGLLTLSALDQRQTRQVTGLAMIKQAFKRLWNDKRGNALLIAGAAMPLMIGSAGLASDTIQWTLWKRQLQRAADSAAIAGVYATVQSQGVNSAVAKDLQTNNKTGIALNSGYPQIAYPPATSAYTNPVRVTLAIQKTLSFSAMFMTAPPVIKATATAATIETGNYCVVSLENTDETGITATGNGNITLGCGMITNSISLDAAIATGSATVVASPVAAVGGIGGDQWSGSTELLPFTIAQEDPFKDVYPPTPTGTCSALTHNDSSARHIANPTGTLCVSDIDFSKGTITMDPGTYVIDGGDLDVGSQANVSCTGCTFVLTSRTAATDPSSIGQVTMNGGPDLNLTAPTASGNPFKDILIYQDRRAPAMQGAQVISNKINGSATSTLSGAIYFPSQALDLNGTAKLTITCGQFVARQVTFSGNGGIENSCPGGYPGGGVKGRHVRLVA